MRDLGDFLAEGGAIVGGSAAIGATIGFIVGSVVHDFRPGTDPDDWARQGAAFGGLVRLAALLDRDVDWRREAAYAEVRDDAGGRGRRPDLRPHLARLERCAFFAGEAVVVTLVCVIGLPWMEFAPDGAFRHRPET